MQNKCLPLVPKSISHKRGKTVRRKWGCSLTSSTSDVGCCHWWTCNKEENTAWMTWHDRSQVEGNEYGLKNAIPQSHLLWLSPSSLLVRQEARAEPKLSGINTRRNNKRCDLSFMEGLQTREWVTWKQRHHGWLWRQVPIQTKLH